jgi:hypothetical protein
MNTLLLICGLFCGYVIYKQGVKDGIALSKGKEVTVIPNVIQAVKDHKEQKETKEEEKAILAAADNLFSYDGFKQKVGE